MPELPKIIDPCPIVEAIFEIRFTSSLPDDAIFGTLYNHFKDEYPKFEQLPILQLPPAVRAQDPNLKNSPHYKAQIGNFILQIGPKVLSISNVENYVGWDLYSAKIFSIYKKLEESEIVNNIDRIGLRYINVLAKTNIFNHSNVILSLKGKVISRKTNITSELQYEKATCTLKITSDAEVQIGSNEKRMIKGSVIDIDTFIEGSKIKDINQAIQDVHDTEKQLFFDILTDDFINTLNPKY